MKITEVLQVLSDPTRLRMLRLLGQEELSVAELQEILEMGQSRISSHLGLLRRNELVSDRKDGKRTYYVLDIDPSPKYEFLRLALSEESDEEFWLSDQSALSRIVDRRRRESERYFDEVAERLGKNYVPRKNLGSNWTFSLSSCSLNYHRRFGCGGGYNFSTLSRPGKESNLYR